MLSYFPSPYPDEIFYSLVARYFLHIGCSNQPIKVFSILFGKEYNTPILDIPRNLSHFHQRVGENLKSSLHQIIDKFTLFPLISPYISASQKQLIIESMTTSSGKTIYTANTNPGTFPSLKRPRYCPYCFEEDLITYGEAYWHRSHQVHSLPFCTTHSCYLSAVPITPETLNTSFFIPPVREYCPQVAAPKLDNPEAVGVAKALLMTLTENKRDNIKPALYRSILLQSSLGKGENTVDLLAFYNAFSAFYSESTLKLFSSQVDFSKSYSWLKASVRKKKSPMDPIRHILLQGFLSSIEKKKAGASNAPQRHPCRNKICNFYNEFNCYRLEQHDDSKSKRNIETICCPNCGYIYTRSFKKESKQYIFKVKEYGWLWKEKLQNLQKKRISVTQSARILGSNPRTIRNQYAKLCYKNPPLSDEQGKEQLQQKRSQWTALIKENIQLAKTHLKHLQPGLFKWLYRNDRPWLNSLNYAKPNYTVPSKIIDWKIRDQEYFKIIQTVFEGLILNEKKRRISKTLLLNHVPQLSITNKTIDKMPTLKEYLNSVSETPEKHMLRRLDLAYKDLSRQSLEISRMHLLQQAKILKKHRSPTIEAKIQQLLLSQQ